jgi:hypothetical protein
VPSNNQLACLEEQEHSARSPVLFWFTTNRFHDQHQNQKIAKQATREAFDEERGEKDEAEERERLPKSVLGV